MRHRTIPTVMLAGLLALTAACGDDDDAATESTVPATSPAPTETTASVTAPPATEASEPAADTTIAGTDTTSGTVAIDPADAEYCAAVTAINESPEPPTAEVVEAYMAVAPAELQDPLQLVLDTLEEADGDFTAVFSDPEAGAALEEITAFEAERCGSGDEGPPQDPMVTVIDEEATRVDVVATEYAYEAELPTTAGRYSFVMTNEGEEPHIMILLRLEDGASVDEVLAAEGDEGVAESFESSPAAPSGEGVLTADLSAGSWVLLCPIPGPEGHPHFADGMITEFTIE